MSKNIVPFGKYKGQPVEVLHADPQYREWLSSQAWFREKFAELFKMLASVQAPTETPEHNAMQAKFLDDEYLYSFVNHYYYKDFIYPQIARDRALHIAEENKKRERATGWSRTLQRGPPPPFQLCTLPQIKREDIAISVLQRFEIGGNDVLLHASATWGHLPDNWPFHQDIGIELKPTLGDEFPAVLRQVSPRFKGGVNLYLIVGEYTGVGATWEQVKKIFARSFICCVLESDYNSGEGQK